MKKNIMMRLASFLLVAVLISTSAISGTYAKYVTAKNGSDDARVAKWGVKIQLNEEMFSDSYKDEATDWTANEQLDTITVQADTKDVNVVAPGTKGVLADFSVTGKPEVDVEVTYTATLILDGWEVDGNVYCPIIFNVGSEKFQIGENGISDIAGLKAAVEAAIVAKTAKYHTNTDLSEVNDDLEVTWEWPFYVNNTNDVKDTALGNQAADGNAATIKLLTSMTVTQIN